MRLLITFSIVIIFFSSCVNRNQEQDCKGLNIPVKFLNSDTITNSLLGDNIQFIKLETTKGFLLGEINKLIIEDDLIYILTKKTNAGIYVFNLEGNAIFKIADVGKGPGEFISINDFYIKEDKIYINDPRQKLIHIYNSKTGKFINSQKVKLLIREIENIADLSYVVNINTQKNDSSLCKIINSGNKIITELLTANKNSYIKGHQLYQFENNIYLIDEKHNSILKLNTGKIESVYNFDFGKYNMTEEKYRKFTKQELRDRGIAHEFTGLCTNNDLLIAKIVVQGSLYRLYHNFNTNQALCYSLFNSKHITAGANYHFANDTAFFGTISSDFLFRFKRYHKIQNNYSLIATLPDEINAANNPYLVINIIK